MPFCPISNQNPRKQLVKYDIMLNFKLCAIVTFSLKNRYHYLKPKEIMKTTNLLLTSLVLFFIGCTNAQWNRTIKGNGKETTETRSVDPYDILSVHGNMDITLVEGSEGNITLKGEENILEYIEVTNTNGKLRIKTKDNINIRPSSKKGIYIEVPIQEVSKILLSGSGEISGKLTLKTEKLKLSVSGSGDIKIAADATAIKATISGSGDINISGKAAEFDASVTGSGDIDAAQLSVAQATANITGSGDIKIHAKDQLTVKIVGSGDVKVNKDVTTINKKVVGSGEISKY